jgi:lipoic acid synthetase
MKPTNKSGPRRRRTTSSERKPPWLKVQTPGGSDYVSVKRVVRDLKLNTVCEEAHCPNLGECWGHRTATFIILGDVCTRNCAYCAVSHGKPPEYDEQEPERLATAAVKMDLRHIVITSVNRDDLRDGGAEIFARCIREIHARLPETTVEVLVPDFGGSDAALEVVLAAEPDILNHNLETVERLYAIARPGGRYQRALQLLRTAKERSPEQLTKSGLMCGMGEEWDELIAAMRALRCADVDILTVGQYLRPSASHIAVGRFYTPDEFTQLAEIGQTMGFRHVEAGPLVRSSYHAWEQVARVTASK